MCTGAQTFSSSSRSASTRSVRLGTLLSTTAMRILGFYLGIAETNELINDATYDNYAVKSSHIYLNSEGPSGSHPFDALFQFRCRMSIQILGTHTSRSQPYMDHLVVPKKGDLTLEA